MNTTTNYLPEPGICPDEYEFHCSVADCTEHSHNVEDFMTCDGCGRPVCALHDQPAATLDFCPECFHCSVCGEEAALLCDSCGDLLCAGHGHVFDGGEEREYLCGECLENQKPYWARTA